MQTLDDLIKAAHARAEKTRIAAETAARDERERNRRENIEQLQREMQRAIGSDLVQLLSCRFETQDEYPQTYAIFFYRNVELHLNYYTERDERRWRLYRPDGDRGSRIGEKEYREPLPFVERLLLEIDALTTEPPDIPL